MDIDEDLDVLISEAASCKPNAQIRLLQSLRSQKAHQPDLVLFHGSRLLKNHRGMLGDEVWSVMQQVFLAAVDLQIDEWAAFCIKALMSQFPNSIRVTRLYAMYKESVMEWEEAKEHYESILRDKPEDTASKKRLIAMYKARGRTAEAIDAMNKYLEVFGTDAEAWHELGELYLTEANLGKAAFCYEELILNNPRSIYNVLTYAELQFSLGEMEVARKYFCLAAHLDGQNVRALWGLLLVLLAATTKKGGGELANPNEKLVQLQDMSVKRLEDQYKALKGSPAHAKVALALIDGLKKPATAE